MSVLRNLAITAVGVGAYGSARLGCFGTKELKLVDVYGCSEIPAVKNKKLAHHRYILADNFTWQTSTIDKGVSNNSLWTIKPINTVIVDTEDNLIERCGPPDSCWNK